MVGPIQQHPDWAVVAVTPQAFHDEYSWLRHGLSRLRTILRYAKDARVESGLREVIANQKSALSN